jgi:hypothetical protein
MTILDYRAVYIPVQVVEFAKNIGKQYTVYTFAIPKRKKWVIGNVKFSKANLLPNRAGI